jgi:hypothetical protein
MSKNERFPTGKQDNTRGKKIQQEFRIEPRHYDRLGMWLGSGTKWLHTKSRWENLSEDDTLKTGKNFIQIRYDDEMLMSPAQERVQR